MTVPVMAQRTTNMNEVDLDGFILIMMEDKKEKSQKGGVDSKDLYHMRITVREKVEQKSNTKAKLETRKVLFRSTGCERAGRL